MGEGWFERALGERREEREERREKREERREKREERREERNENKIHHKVPLYLELPIVNDNYKK